MVTLVQASILEVLRLGPNCGTAIRAIVLERTAGNLDLSPGTLYPSLHGMVRDGLVLSDRSPPNGKGGRPKVVYTLTEKGSHLAGRLREQVRSFYG